MVSFGGCVGYFLSSIDWKSSYVSSFFSSDATQELISFSILSVLFLITVILTFVTTRDGAISPYRSRDDDLEFLLPTPIIQSPPYSSSLCPPSNHGIATSSPSILSSSSSPTSSRSTIVISQKNGHAVGTTPLPLSSLGEQDLACTPPFLRSPSPPPSPGALLPRCLVYFAPSQRLGFHMRKWTSKIAGRFSTFRAGFRAAQSFLSGASSFLRRRLRQSVTAVHLPPPILVPLMIAHFFSWSAMMALHIFYTDFVGRAIMAGDPNAAVDSPDYAKYDLGIRIGSQVRRHSIWLS